MQKTVYKSLAEGQSINRWNVSEPTVQRFMGVARPMPDRVNYQFVNGWVNTGDLPCRQAWYEHVAKRTRVLEDVRFPAVYCGFENPRVDFSCFCFQPTVVGRWARCTLKVAVAQTLEFKVTTCGGIFVWCNRSLSLVHEPYSRNTPASVDFSLALEPGDHDIICFFDDLHERDTSYYFQLQLLKGSSVETGMLTRSDPQRLSEIEQMMAGLRMEKLFYGNENLRITSDRLPSESTELTLLAGGSMPVQQASSDKLSTRHAGRQISVQLAKSTPVVDVIAAKELMSGCPELVWQCTVGDVIVRRKIGTSVLTEPVDLALLVGNDRCDQFLQIIADTAAGMPAYALVMLHLNQWNEQAQNNFERLLEIVSARDDCADFHIMPLVWIASRFTHRLSAHNQQRLKTTLLEFRYWLDEPGNDVMWFWSENHVLCFHVAQYLAGELYPDSHFNNSGKTGRAHAQQARARLHRWFDSVEKHGLAEWNSAAYYPIDLRGLLTLHGNAKDEVIVQRAQLLIDRLFLMVAMHTINGVPTGAQGRAYEKELLAGPATELGAVTAVGFGGCWYRGHDTAAALLAMSDYAVSTDLDACLHVPVGQGLTACYFQGLDNNAELHLWKTADVQLSTVCNHKSGLPGHQQHLLDLQFAGHPHARLWINHPGELQVWGEGRPSYWAGNGLLPRVESHEDCAMMIYDLTVDENAIEFTHLFCPEDVLDEIRVVNGNWLFTRCRGGYAAVFCSGTLEPVKTGLYAGSEWRLNELIAAWLVIVGSEHEYGSFEAFMNICVSRQARFCLDSNALTVMARNGREQLSLSFSSRLHVDGEVVDNSAVTNVPQAHLTPLAGISL